GFWQKFRKRVDAIKPEAWTIAEEWRDASNYLLGDMFNATMNYRLTWTVRGFFAMDYLSTSEFDDRLQALLRDTPPPAVHSQMNLLDSHDTDRLLTACGRNRARYLQAFAFLFAYPGAPTIFYGSETGIEGSFSEDSRRPMPWDSLDEELLTFFKHIIQVRKNDVTLRRGQVETILIDDENRVFGLRRYDAARSIVALFNASDTPVQVEVELPENEADGTWTDLLDIHVDVPAQAGKLSLTLAARGAAWYAKK
ncbi:MAG: alpha-amylase family glycosyl hydrolase, partial [Chloroflexota bacterium]